MAQKSWEITDEFWSKVEPLIANPRRDPNKTTTVRLKYMGTICKEVELFRSIPVWRFLQGIPVQIEDLDQGEV